jgi:hypothetical protein
VSTSDDEPTTVGCPAQLGGEPLHVAVPEMLNAILAIYRAGEKPSSTFSLR